MIGDQAMSNFDRAFEAIVGHEGGYVNHPRDPGGETKYGISKRSYPHTDIKNLTINQAKHIYFHDFWTDKLDQIPYMIALQVFDAAVNSGRGNAVRWLQRAAGVADDGIFGPITLAAVLRADPAVLAALMLAERLGFMTQLSTWATFGRGWARRIASNLKAIGQTDD